MSERAARGEHPDIVFVNGRILTMEGSTPHYAEAVVVRKGRIVFVGPRAAAIEAFPAATLRDLEGRTLLPGFVDAHSHLSFGFDLVDRVNVGVPPVGDCRDIPGVIAALERFRDERSVPAGAWIVAWGYDQEGLAEDRHIQKHELDSAFPDHRVVLVHVSSHGAVLNSAALAWAGIDATTSAPPGGVIARYEGSNEPSGLLMETAYLLLVADRMPHPDDRARRALLDDVQQLYASQGYTHIQDGFSTVAGLDFFQEAARDGLLYLDVVALGSFVESAEWIGDPAYPVGEYRDGFKIAGMKIIADGSPQGRTAFLTDPYLTGGPGGEEEWRGEATFPYEVFSAKLAEGIAAGVQVFVHVNGDAAIDDLIRAVRESGTSAADDRRPVAIHSQVQREDHLDAYLELGITPSYFTNHVYFWGDVHVANLGSARASFISPMRSARERGIVVSNHSDFTVTPLDPFAIMWTAMTRTTRSGVVLGAPERIDAYAALQAMTTGPAHQMFEEGRKGRIAEGLLADFVVLSHDPLEVGGEGIRAIEVLETIKEGVTVYRPER